MSRQALRADPELIRHIATTQSAMLASAALFNAPEDVLGGASDPKRKDCFLLGMTIHELTFDRPPAERQPGDPPEWDKTVDVAGSFRHLHPWFATALAWEPRSRFSDASAMLASFNEATASGPS
jgi:hypothetical protein